jgi:hypothetical protein
MGALPRGAPISELKMGSFLWDAHERGGRLDLAPQCRPAGRARVNVSRPSASTIARNAA